MILHDSPDNKGAFRHRIS